MVPVHVVRCGSPNVAPACRPSDAPPYPPAGRRQQARSYSDPLEGLHRLLARFSGAHGVVLVEFALPRPLMFGGPEA